MKIYAFADESSPVFDEQILAMQRNNLDGLEIRGVDGVNISEITIEISQIYSSRSIKVSNDNGNYQIVYVRNSHMSPSVDRYPRTLSIAEAVWLEKQVEGTIKNPDESTWQSLPGGDTMSIVIKRNNGKDISRGGQPIRKYSDLQNELEKLVRYGSLADH